MKKKAHDDCFVHFPFLDVPDGSHTIFVLSFVRARTYYDLIGTDCTVC